MKLRHTFIFFLGLGAVTLTGCATNSSSNGATGCNINVNAAALDTNGDTKLSRAEVRGSALESVFDRVDSNGDGVISQSEYVNRCSSLRATQNDDNNASGWDDTVVGKRADRQSKRQQNRVDRRVNQETDQATDTLIDKIMGKIFGD